MNNDLSCSTTCSGYIIPAKHANSGVSEFSINICKADANNSTGYKLKSYNVAINDNVSDSTPYHCFNDLNLYVTDAAVGSNIQKYTNVNPATTVSQKKVVVDHIADVFPAVACVTTSLTNAKLNSTTTALGTPTSGMIYGEAPAATIGANIYYTIRCPMGQTGKIN